MCVCMRERERERVSKKDRKSKRRGEEKTGKKKWTVNYKLK